MSRKETPDVLAEILTAAPAIAPSQPPVAVQPAPPRARRSAKPKAQAASSASEPAPQPQTEPKPPRERWEYLVVSLQNYRGWRPRFINGQEIRNWAQAPVIHEYVDQLGEDGWELVAASAGKQVYGASDQYQLYFKRAKH